MDDKNPELSNLSIINSMETLMNQTYCISKYTIVSRQLGSRCSIYNTMTGNHAILDLEDNPTAKVLLADQPFTQQMVEPEMLKA